MNTRKLLFLITVCFAVNVGSAAGTSAAPRNNRKVTTRVSSTLNRSLHKANDLLDYMLTVKGATKIAVLISPFVYLYCRYYGVSPTSEIVNKVIQMIGNAKANYDIQINVGKSEAFWNNLLEHPASSASAFGSELFGKAVKCGIPFVAGLLVKLGIGTN